MLWRNALYVSCPKRSLHSQQSDRACVRNWRLQNGEGDKLNGANDGPTPVGPLEGAQNPSTTCTSYEAMRRKFFQLLYGHIVHKSDVTSFEDTCRSMLGANSYVLFTIQKLVNKFARHLSGLIAVRPGLPQLLFLCFRCRKCCLRNLSIILVISGECFFPVLFTFLLPLILFFLRFCLPFLS